MSSHTPNTSMEVIAIRLQWMLAPLTSSVMAIQPAKILVCTATPPHDGHGYTVDFTCIGIVRDMMTQRIAQHKRIDHCCHRKRQQSHDDELRDGIQCWHNSL